MDLGDAYADKFMLITCLWFQVTLEEILIRGHLFMLKKMINFSLIYTKFYLYVILDASALAWHLYLLVESTFISDTKKKVDASDFKETYYYSININFIASAAKIQVIKRGLFTTILKNDTIETVREKADLMPDVRKQDIRNFLPPVIFFFGFGTQTQEECIFVEIKLLLREFNFSLIPPTTFILSCLATQQYHQG
ncbi:hypothetical protein ACJX0J_014796 [Zea mays]